MENKKATFICKPFEIDEKDKSGAYSAKELFNYSQVISDIEKVISSNIPGIDVKFNVDDLVIKLDKHCEIVLCLRIALSDNFNPVDIRKNHLNLLIKEMSSKTGYKALDYFICHFLNRSILFVKLHKKELLKKKVQGEQLCK